MSRVSLASGIGKRRRVRGDPASRAHKSSTHMDFLSFKGLWASLPNGAPPRRRCGRSKELLLPLGHVVQIKPDLSPEAWTELAGRESPLRFQAPDGSFYLTDEELLEARDLGLRFEMIRRIAEADLPVRFSLPHDGAVNDWPPEDARLAVLARLLAEDRAGGSVHIRFLGRNHTVPPDGFALDRAGGQRRYVWQVIPAEVHAARPALHDRFQRLRAVCADPGARVVLSLGSGGLKLFAHATAIRLFETLGIGDHFAEVWGSSAGAMAGLLVRAGSVAARDRAARLRPVHRARRSGAAALEAAVPAPSGARRAAAVARHVGRGLRRLRRRPVAHARALLRRDRAPHPLLLHRLQPAALPPRGADARRRARAPRDVHGADGGALGRARVGERSAAVRAARGSAARTRRRTTSTARRPRTCRCTRSCASGTSTARRASRRASDS